jgi:hypothetical protein
MLALEWIILPETSHGSVLLLPMPISRLYSPAPTLRLRSRGWLNYVTYSYFSHQIFVYFLTPLPRLSSDACLYASALVKVDTAPLTNGSTADAPPAPSSLPEHEHPLAGEALAWAYRKGRHIYADPVTQRLEAIGALLDLELMIVPPVPRSEIMAALDELVTGLPTVDPAPGPQEEIDIQWLDGNLQPPPLSP